MDALSLRLQGPTPRRRHHSQSLSRFLRTLISYCRFLMMASLSSVCTLTTGLLLMCLVLCAYLSVLCDSSKLASDGERHAIIMVRAFPPRESCEEKTENL